MEIKLIIKRSIKQDGNIKPEVYNLLNHLPEDVLHYNSYGYIHPLGIYNRSFAPLINGFVEVLGELNKVSEEIKDFKVNDQNIKFNSTKLLRAQKELLHSIQSHIDDCYHILKATTPYPNMEEFNSNTRRSMKRSPYQWLIHTNPCVSDFKDNINEYKFFIDSIVNKLKHQHRRLRDVIYISDFETRIGYFVEGSGVNEDGNVYVGPDSDIHLNDIVFSYSRDLSFHFYNIYVLSYHLKDTLLKSFEKQYNLKLEDDFYLKEDSTDIIDVANEICQLNLRFFNKEYFNSYLLLNGIQILIPYFYS